MDAPGDSRILVIGLTGLPGAGKDTAALVLRRLGFTGYVFSDVVREEARRRGIANPDRTQLQALGDELRARNGAGVLALRLAARIERDRPERCFVNGVRHVLEWRTLQVKPQLRCVLVAISANADVRFERLRDRARAGDPESLEVFRRIDARDRGGVEPNDTTLQVGQVIALADHVIANNGDVSSFESCIGVLVTSLAHD